MIRKKFLICLGAAGILMAGCACLPRHRQAGKPMRVEMRYGTALEAIKIRQVYEPGRKAAMIKGIDGQTAAIIMDKYRESFKKPKPPTFVVPVGDIAE